VSDVIASLQIGNRECCSFWTTSGERLNIEGPLGRIWRSAGDLVDRITFREMPVLPARRRRVGDCIGKHLWWERRPGGGEGA
jgi:hypothetical protein